VPDTGRMGGSRWITFAIVVYRALPKIPQKIWSTTVPDIVKFVCVMYANRQVRKMCDKSAYREAPPQTPEELLAKSAMVKKKVDADRLEERKKSGEYMKILREGVR
jgi:hypothetical protein